MAVDALTARELEAVLEEAVSRRETPYSNFFTFHFHRDEDNLN
jgi:hypothetical protein